MLPSSCLPDGPPEQADRPGAVQAAAHARGARPSADGAQARRGAESRALGRAARARRHQPGGARQPGATVLGVHPTKQGRRRQAAAGAHRRRGGQGARADARPRDDSWRWGFADKAGDERGRAYQRFWDAAIRWLIRDPALAFLRIETDQPEYARGQKVQVTVRALGTDYQPLRARQARRGGGAHPDGARRGVDGAAGAGGGAARRHRRGRRADASSCRRRRRAAIASPRGRRSPGGPSRRTKCSWCAAPGASSRSRRRATICLRAVASATGGSFRGPGESLDGLQLLAAARRARQPAPRRRAVEPLVDAGWSPPAASALNWALRRRWGYA